MQEWNIKIKLFDNLILHKKVFSLVKALLNTSHVELVHSNK